MLLKNLQDFKQKLIAKEVQIPLNVKLWGGADVVIGAPNEKNLEQLLRWSQEGQLSQVRIGNGAYFTYDGMTYLITRHARELSHIVYWMKEQFSPAIDSFNKYAFYGRLADAAGAALAEGRASIAMVDEAIVMAQELMAETELYFGYGANMHEATMAYRCPGATKMALGVLHGHRWLINERGVSTVTADEKQAQVFGVLWNINEEHEQSLDGYEGVHDGHYFKDLVYVEAVKDGKTMRLPAKIYIDPVTTPGTPREGYLEKILEAAQTHDFPADYIRSLEKTASCAVCGPVNGNHES